jgi:sterol desaturase/sphingolipid hydroxylase (fatty acid hydroxylase superfamily)
LALLWLQGAGLGLFNAYDLPPGLEAVGAILALDLAWCLNHWVMHRVPGLWRFHAVHHSDLALDATTTIRQHPGETMIRFVFLSTAAFALGASPLAFAIYRVWAPLHGMFEHANIKLPHWLDTAISMVFTSPNMHKIHHARERRFTDSNYGNIFSLWDRLFATFTPSKLGANVAYGLDRHDRPEQHSLFALLASPLQKPR